MSDGVEAWREGCAGRIRLNRPKTLNALDLGMVQAIAAALFAWADEPGVHLVVLQGAGERAFCAGGDIRSIRQWVLDGAHAEVEAFFAQEYALNRQLARYPKPVVSLIDGICMGGGIGLSVHGTVRAVSERARLAMPETQIGFFPDVGASYVLPRLRGRFGMYLGLTGARIEAADACWLGMATHFVPSAAMAGLGAALAAEGIGALTEAARPPEAGRFAGLRAAVDACFGGESVAAVAAALGARDEEWAREAAGALAGASPSALGWSFALLRDGARMTFEQCQQAELALTRRVTRHPDFVEGVRAAVVDKDRQPKWVPAA